MTSTPTGHHTRRDDRDSLTWERTFRAPIEDVWASITETDRLERWIGTWTGDPAEGFVTFTMTAEGEDVPASRYDIRTCEPPHLLRIDAIDDFGAWYLTLELTETGGTTTLTMSQVIDDVATIESTGPGWDYYLDRLVAAASGGDVGAVDWDTYYPAMREHYVAIAETIRPGTRETLDSSG